MALIAYQIADKALVAKMIGSCHTVGEALVAWHGVNVWNVKLRSVLRIATNAGLQD